MSSRYVSWRAGPAQMDAWWRAANYLSGQTYLCDNLLLKKPLKKEHVKPRLGAIGARRRD